MGTTVVDEQLSSASVTTQTAGLPVPTNHPRFSVQTLVGPLCSVPTLFHLGDPAELAGIPSPLETLAGLPPKRLHGCVQPHGSIAVEAGTR